MSSSDSKSISIGDTFPTDVKVYETSPVEALDLKKIFDGQKVVVFAVPGAFTPGCSRTHLPGYVNDSEKILSKGYNSILCISVNDPFVMQEWCKAHKTEGKVRMIADTNGELVKKLGLAFDAKPLGGTRSKRWSMIVDNGKITQLNVEPDNTGLTCSLSNGLKL